MELNQELIEKHGLSEDAVKDIVSFGAEFVANEKNALSEALKGEATKNAERILDGAASKIAELTGVKRGEGQKIADYITDASNKFLQSKQSKLDELKAEYEQKVKSAGGADLDKIKAEYQADKDELLKKYADYDELKEKATKADTYSQKLTEMQKQVAYGKVKPNFPESVNIYEAKAKWADFIKGVEEKYNIELDENNDPLYIAKDNKFKTGKLSDLVENDPIIKELAQGRQQVGLGTKPKEENTIDGVPFTIQKGADKAAIQKKVRDYLTTEEKLDFTSKEYSKRFNELYTKIKQETAA